MVLLFLPLSSFKHMSASYPKTTDCKKFNPHSTHHPFPAKFSRSVKKLFYSWFDWSYFVRPVYLYLHGWLGQLSSSIYIIKVLSWIILLTTPTTTIIIKRISTAPICRTRLYNNARTHARTHAHTHTYTHTRTHTHTHTHTHKQNTTTHTQYTHSRVGRGGGGGGIGSAVKNKNGIFHGNNGNKSRTVRMYIYVHIFYFIFKWLVIIYTASVWFCHTLSNTTFSTTKREKEKITSQYKRPQNTYCITP